MSTPTRSVKAAEEALPAGDPPSYGEVAHGETPNGEESNGANFQRNIGSRQMVFFALAGGIGAGLFVASGSALSAGGPGNALVNYAIVGMMVCTTMGALGELASMFFLHPLTPDSPISSAYPRCQPRQENVNESKKRAS